MKKKILPLLLVFTLSFAAVLALQIFLGRLFYKADEALISHYENLYQTERYETSEGALIRLKDIQSPIIIVSFWASNCAPCIVEFQNLEKFYKNHGSEKIFFLAINVEENGAEKIKRWQNEFKIPVSYLEDKTGELLRKYQVQTTPTSFIFSHGHFLGKTEGPVDFEAVLQKLN